MTTPEDDTRDALAYLEARGYVVVGPDETIVDDPEWLRAEVRRLRAEVRRLRALLGVSLARSEKDRRALEHLSSRDQGTLRPGQIAECPECGADLRGEEIPPEQRAMFGGATHGSRLIAIHDRASERTECYRCPDCEARIEREQAWSMKAWVPTERQTRLKSHE
jgi:uncharacterized protein with PIN domain